MGRRKYVNGEPLVVSAAAMIARVQADPNFPAEERAIATWAIRSACRWSGRDPAVVSFSASSARGLLADTSPGKAGVSKKTLQNARSAIERLLRFYSLEATTLFSVPLTTELAEWFGRFSKYEKAGTSRFFRFLSVRGRTIGDVVDDDAQAFLATLNAELPEKAARAKHKIALQTWNRVGASCPDWPGRQLKRRLDREAWALSWERFPSSLKMAVDVLFAARQVDPDLFEQQPIGNRLKPTTVRTRVEHLRIGASILCIRCGLQPGELTCLADLSRPDRFKAIIGAIVERYDGKVTAYVEQIAVTLLQAARECGALSDAEVAEVRGLRHRVYRRGLSDRKNDVGADQQILDELDDSDRMDALLALPTKTVMRVQRSGRIDRAAALEIQMALALHMWLAAPLRITNFVMLRLDQHVHRVTVGRKTRVIIRVPGTETKNGKPVEHYLHDAAADLLELYLTVYRPLLVEQASPWLFPGRNNNHKRTAVLARQIKAYIWEGAGIRFHPHLIRKIITKIKMDHDPGSIEIVRIMLGHADTRTTRSAYTQAQVRSAQTLYLNAMEQRRLAAIGRLRPAVQRASAPKALRLGKGRRVQQGREK